MVDTAADDMATVAGTIGEDGFSWESFSSSPL